MTQRDINWIDEGQRNVDERTASKFLGLAVSSLRNMRHQRRGPVYAKLGKSVRYQIKDLLNYIEQNKIDPEKLA